MINQFYKNFKVRDYLGDVLISDKLLDCSLGTNPFIEENQINNYILATSYEINKYPINIYQQLKKELVRFWKENTGIDISMNHIAFGSGTMGILRNISEFLIETGSYVLGCAPQFPRFISEVELKKGIYEYYTLEEKNNYKFIVNDFLEKIDGKYSVIYIDNPNNPTGQIIDVDEIEKILIEARPYNITVIIDEAYGDYMEMKNSSIMLVHKYDNVVVLRSASKFFGLPNHRIGYLIASEEFIKVYDMISIPFPFSDLSCNIFMNALQDYDNLKKTKIKVIETNKKIYEAIKQENFLYTSIETPIFTIKSKKHKNVFEELMRYNIISEKCNHFINLNDECARIRINSNAEKLIEGLKKVIDQ